jgi:hypothetical protein
VSVYTDTIREHVLTPEAVENVQRAAMLLRVARDDVKEAIDLLAPVQAAWDRTVLDRLIDTDDCSDEDHDEVRFSTPYGEAIDLAFEILDQAKRIEMGTG